MPTGTRKEPIESRGSTARNDGLHPIDGGGPITWSFATPESTGAGATGTGGKGTDAFGKTSWFDPVDQITVFSDKPAMECKDGVCPVPWAVKEKAPVIQEDEVNHPPHYTDGEIECIEAIEAALTPEEFRGYCKGNLMKYGWRERMKGGTKSLKKGQWYLDRLIAFDEAQNG